MSKLTTIPVPNKPYLEDNEYEESEKLVKVLLKFAIQNTDNLYEFLKEHSISLETFNLFYERYMKEELLWKQ